MMRQKGYGILSMEKVTTLTTIEGNIGSGKTTLLNALRAHIEENELSAFNAPPSVDNTGRDLFVLLDEPVDIWSVKNCSLLNCAGEAEKKEEKKNKLFDIFNIKQKDDSDLEGTLFVSVVFSVLLGALFGNTVVTSFIGALLAVITALAVSAATGGYARKKEKKNKLYSFLDLFYKGQNEEEYPESNPFALDFQVNAFTSRLDNMTERIDEVPDFSHESNTRIHVISERSLHTDRLFFKNVYESGRVPKYQWDLYERFHKTICSTTLQRTDSMVFVSTQPETCCERINQRQREAEVKNGIPLKYLMSLDEGHKEMIHSFASKKGEESVIVLDFERDMNKQEIAHVAADLIEKLKTK